MPLGRDQLVEVLFTDQVRLVGYVLVIVGDSHLAEDVAQDVFKLAFERCETFNDPQHLRAWLRVTARNLALGAMRRRSRGPQLLDSAVLDLIEGNWAKLDRLDPESIRRALHHCLATLSPYARQIVELRYGQNLRGPRLADRLGRSLAGVYKALTRIHHGLASCIREHLERETERG